VIQGTDRFLAEVESADEKKYPGYDENDILEQPRNEYPRRDDKKESYETLDSKW
jgi:hypothetical protein